MGIRENHLREREIMTTGALALNTDGLQGVSGLPAEPVLRRATTLLADLIKPCGKFGADDPEEADGWARRFYESWVEGLSSEEYSALDEYKRDGFRSLNRGLRDHDGDICMLSAEDRLRAAGLDAALEKAPPLERPVVAYAGGFRTRYSRHSRPARRRPS
jgi:hypothetical protein